MRLTTEKGELTLRKDFKFEITTNHPFFSDDGTASAPATIPSSSLNREILDFPDNPARRSVYTRVLNGTLHHGTFFKPCKIIVSGASRQGGISASLAFRESEMYVDIQDLLLPDLFEANKGEDFDFDIPMPWYFYAREPRRQSSGSSFTFFPVAADYYEKDGVKRVNIINKPTSSKEFVYAARNIYRGDERMAVPLGYGMAPYFYLCWVIRRTFEYCGYEVETNVFETDTVLQKIVLLHPYADLLVGQRLQNESWHPDAGRMVPSITVGELITFLRDKFGAFVTVRAGKVSIRLFETIAATGFDADLSGMLLGELSLSYPERSLLTMTQQKDIESAEAAADTMPALRETYQSLAEASRLADISGSGLFHVGSLGKYYQRKNTIDGSGNTVATVTKVGSEAFDFKRKIDGIEAETEVSPDDSYVPMVYDETSGLYMPYVGESCHANIEIEGKEKGANVPIMLCYARYYSDSAGSNDVHAQGQTTSFHYLNMSQSYTGLIPLTPEGIVPEYWAQYWKILASGAPEITCQLKLSLEQLENMDLFTPKLLNGVRVLIKSIKYTIGANGVSPCEATLQLLPVYDDIPTIDAVVFNSNVLWKYVNTRTVFAYGDSKNGVEILETDGLTDYDPTSDLPSYTPNRTGIKAKLRKRWVKYKTYQTKWFPRFGTIYEHSSWTSVHQYEEYFLSYLEE